LFPSLKQYIEFLCIWTNSSLVAHVSPTHLVEG
jgi:hypothetical protein